MLKISYLLMHILFKLSSNKMNHLCGVMSSMLISSSVDPGFEPWSVKPKTTIGIWCFFAKHAALMIKSKDW
jgi:ABC-type thiamin/hydroxymethylpyrimidine transport system permease subunit